MNDIKNYLIYQNIIHISLKIMDELLKAIE